uniref:Brca1-associated protein n=1 Tax=Amblyomma aureolatum TaxID=187763 RepID=A0A1E1X5M3_9ACAR
MSVSLVTLKLEVASDFPILPHINYVSARARRLEYCAIAPFQRGEWHSSKLEEIRKESRGCRKPHDIVIETVTIETDDMASKQAARCQRKGDPLGDRASAESSAPKESDQKQCADSEGNADAGSGCAAERSKPPALSQIPFFSGNHNVEVTKGILHLFKENQQTSLGEAERSEMLCMLAVPALMTLHDLLQFIAPVSAHVESIRVIRDSKPNLYMVLLKFRGQKWADEFYQNFNGERFNSIEPEVCHLAYVSQVQMVKEGEGDAVPGHTELPTCPVCLERMDESVEGILTILCNHTFHDGCLAKWGDSSCPVCRYCQTPESVPDNRCFSCGSQENLWICLICGHIGCGRYVEAHAYNHYARTDHTFAMQLGNNSVWDYAGDNYVHRLVQNKTDGKLVELETSRTDSDEKLDSVQLEYTYLLTSQLEKQRRYFEDCMEMFQKDNSRQINELKEKTQIAVEERKELEQKLRQVTKDRESVRRKSEQLSQQLTKTKAELQEEKEINKCLRENQVAWQSKLKDVETRLQELQETKDKEIQDLQEQLRDLMFYLDAKEKIGSSSAEMQLQLQEGTIVVGNPGPSGTPTQKQRRRKNR